MTDIVDTATRSRMMSRISGRNTKPELIVRQELHRLGLRFRLHRKDLPGRPDIVLPRWNVACFVHGCFWHRHDGCRFAYSPKSRPEFWRKKFARNVERDKEAVRELQARYWRVAVFWECHVTRGDPAQALAGFTKWLKCGSIDRGLWTSDAEVSGRLPDDG